MKIKKFFATILVVAIFMNVANTFVFAGDSINLNEKAKEVEAYFNSTLKNSSTGAESIERIATNPDEIIDLLNRSIVLRANSPLSFVYGKKRFIDELNHNFTPVIDNGRVLLPIRFLSDCIGGQTNWNNNTMTATITYNDKVIEIQLGNTFMKINGEIVDLDVAARSENGRAILPARAISEALDKEVYYNNGFIVISDKGLKIDDNYDEVLNIIKLIQNELIGVNKVGNEKSSFNGKNVTSYLTINGEDIPLETPYNKCIMASSGMYAENLECTKADSNNFKIKMDIYNTASSYGVIEIYDANYNLMPEKTIQIDRLDGSPTSMKECAEKFWDSTYGFGTAIGNMIVGDDTELMYRNSVSGCHTPVDVTVPVGGAILITNDMKQSDYVAAYNAVDLAWDSYKVSKDAFSLGKQDFDSFEKVFKKKIAQEIVKKGIENEQFINAVVADYEITDLKSHIKSQIDTAVGIFNNSDIDLQNIVLESLQEAGLDASIDTGETIFKYFTGPIGTAIDAIFLMSSTGNYIDFLTDMDRTRNGNACVMIFPETTWEANASAEVTITRDDRSIKDNANKLLASFYFDSVEIAKSNENFEAINKILQDKYDAFFQSSSDFSEFVNENPNPYGDIYLNTCEAEITKNNDSILSIKYKKEWYLGGVHNIEYEGVSFDLKTGKKLELADIFALSDKEIEDYLKGQVVNYMKDHADKTWWNDTDNNSIDIINSYKLSEFNFYLDDSNVYLCFPTYELGPGALGSVVVKCPIQI